MPSLQHSLGAQLTLLITPVVYLQERVLRTPLKAASQSAVQMMLMQAYIQYPYTELLQLLQILNVKC